MSNGNSTNVSGLSGRIDIQGPPPPKRVKLERKDDDDGGYVFPLPQPPAVQQWQPPAPAQPRVTNVISNKPSVQQVQSESSAIEDGRKTPPLDYNSVRGRFGWETLGKIHIPFLLRQDDKYTSVRIIESQLLKKFLQALPKEVYSCTYIKSYFITENEAKLLNEINFHHCDGNFGRESFTTSDLVVRLCDAQQFYEFLETCYIKLCDRNNRTSADRCGFIKLNGVIIPYITRDGTKYVPLSFFDRDVESLKMNTEKLEPWGLSYIKFCCKVAGLHTDLNTDDKSAIVSLEDVKRISSMTLHVEEWWPDVSQTSTPSPNKVDHTSWATPGSGQGISSPPVAKQKFEDIKPSQNGTSPHLVSPKLPTDYSNPNVQRVMQSNSWLPSTSPLQNNPSAQSFMFNGQWWGPFGNTGVTGGNITSLPAQGLVYPNVSNAVAKQNIINQQNQGVISNSPGRSSQPPPLIRPSQPPPLIRAPVPGSLAALRIDNRTVGNLTSAPTLHRPTIRQQSPITSATYGNQTTSYSNQTTPYSNYSSYSPRPVVIDLTDPKQAHAALLSAQQAAAAAAKTLLVQYVSVEGKMVPSIDGGQGKRVVTVGHVAAKLFPGVAPQTLLDGLKLVLRVQLQQATSSQIQALNHPQYACSELLDVLVAVDDLLQFMPQLKYMYSSRSSEGDDLRGRNGAS